MIQNSNATVIQNSDATAIQNPNATMIQNSNATVIQNSNAAAIQNSNAAVIQNSNAAAIQNSNAAVIQNTNAAKRQNVDAVGTDGGSDDEAVTCDVDGVFALQRTALPREWPTGKKLDEVKAQMMRMHRAAGHSSFESLARLLEKRQAAKSVELARELRCSDCEESRRITPAPPASTEEPPQLWEYLGMDVFEHEFEEDGSQRKGKFLLMQDRASRLCVVRHLKSYPAAESWEPTTADIRSALINGWMAINPAPTWLIADSAPYFASSELTDFCARSGLGLLIAPAEAHWLMGHEERRIQTLKRTAARLEKEALNITIEEIPFRWRPTEQTHP